MQNKSFILLASCIAFFVVAYKISDAFVPFLISVIISYLALPAVDAMKGCRISRGIASFAVVIVLTICFICLVVFVIPFVISKVPNITQLNDRFDVEAIKITIVNCLGEYFPILKTKASKIFDEIVFSLASDASKFISHIVDRLWFSSVRIVNLATMLFVCPLVTFYTLRDWYSIRDKIINAVPLRYKSDYLSIITSINKNLSGYLHGQVKVALFLSFLYATLLTVAGLHFGIVLGVLIGLVSFIPYIGFLLGFGIALIMAALQFSDVYRILIVLGVLIAGQIVEGSFVTPRVIGNSVNLHPSWVVFGLFASTVTFGIVGMIFALPITAITAAIVRFTINKYMNSDYYTMNKN